VEANSAEVPGNAKLLVDGAVADFDCASALHQHRRAAGRRADRPAADGGAVVTRRGRSWSRVILRPSTCNDRMGRTRAVHRRWEADNILTKLEK